MRLPSSIAIFSSFLCSSSTAAFSLLSPSLPTKYTRTSISRSPQRRYSRRPRCRLVSSHESNGEGENITLATSPASPYPSPSTDYSDPPDRAVSIVSELKANAALFAAFAYGGLSIPGTLTVSESKVTSVTTSLSTTRPIPSNPLIETFVVFDVITLCLMIACVAASQLLIYRLTDGSWEETGYDGDTGAVDFSTRDRQAAITSSPKKQSAMSRLVTSPHYKTEFFIARTTFDLGLITLLLAVAVRTTAIFDESISGPVVVLLVGTALLLLVAFLESYWTVVRPLESQQATREMLKQDQEQSVLRSANGFVPFTLSTVAIASIVYFLFQTQVGRDVAETASSKINPPTSTTTMRQEVRAALDLYSQEAGEAKLKTVLEKIAAEKEGTKSSPGSASKNSKGKDKFKSSSSSFSSSTSAEDGKKSPSESLSASEKETAGSGKDTAAESSPTPSNAEVK